MQSRGITLWLLLLLHVPGLDSATWNLFGKSSTESTQEGEVRLVGGKHDSEGRVEVYHEGKWGTICDDGWDLAEAQVVCRQLKFPGVVSAVTGGTYGEGSGSIWLDDMDCKGTEKSLSSCSFKGWALTDCSHKEDAGVVCARGTDLTSDTAHFLDHSLGLSDDLGELFDRGDDCDFLITIQSPTGNRDGEGKLEVEERNICTHKLILSLYPHFNITNGSSNLSLEMSQACSPCVTSFIRYLYTRKIDVTVSSAQCLHKLASKFGVKRLMQDTGRLFTVLLPEDPSFYTQVSLYQYSVQTGDLLLQENCLQYLAWNCEALINSPAWSDLSTDFLMALLARSDLVVPDEGFLLQALESWIIEKGDLTGTESQAALLGHIRFPMIPAEKLYDLQFTSELYRSHEKLYRVSMLRGFQFNALSFDTLMKHKSSESEEEHDYHPRIYTAEPWSVTINSTNKEPPRQAMRYDYNRRYNNYQPYYPTPEYGKSFTTPNHNSVIYQTKETNPISWSARVFKNQRECSRCISFPTASLSLQSSLRQNQTNSVHFSNRLLLTCEGRYVFHVQDFKNDMAQIPTNSSLALSYPCPEGQYDFRFVVRPEYI
ncbi:galectin-3-binding protein A-like isoform X2 [Oncorhynchus tshawytscha]|nr:galectin-3-binding protein A-like isoform X2 [Oncorhynchus tshawytscha]